MQKIKQQEKCDENVCVSFVHSIFTGEGYKVILWDKLSKYRFVKVKMSFEIYIYFYFVLFSKKTMVEKD